MEELIVALLNSPGSLHDLIVVLVLWIVSREFMPGIISFLKSGKTPQIDLIEEKIAFLYLRERKRQTIEKYKRDQYLKHSQEKH